MTGWSTQSLLDSGTPQSSPCACWALHHLLQVSCYLKVRRECSTYCMNSITLWCSPGVLVPSWLFTYATMLMLSDWIRMWFPFRLDCSLCSTSLTALGYRRFLLWILFSRFQMPWAVWDPRCALKPFRLVSVVRITNSGTHMGRPLTDVMADHHFKELITWARTLTYLSHIPKRVVPYL